MTATVDTSAEDDREPVGGRFQRVVVPLANPETAPMLIEVGKAMVDEADGELFVMTVVSGDAEAESAADSIEALQEIVEAHRDERFDLELDARDAPAIARGVLDYTRERNADLVVIGVQASDRRTGFSQINEAVMEAVHCGALAVRVSTDRDSIDRVVVAVNGSQQSQAAARLGAVIGAAFDAEVVALHVRDRAYSRTYADAMLARSLNGLPNSDSIAQSVVESTTPGRGIAKFVSRRDIVILGSAAPSKFDRLLSTNTAESVLLDSDATVIVVARETAEADTATGRVFSRLRSFRPQLTTLERDSIVWRGAAAAPLSTDFMILLAVSALLASFGLLQNSSAVVIGAMLVAPLLGPLAAVSTGLVTARLGLTGRAMITLMVGTMATIGVAILAGFAIPIDSPTSEMLARGSPSLVDLGVAIAAGVVGAYATARKDIPAALAGVAIAAALVPPICTTGLAIAFGNWDLASGSFLLFATNIVSVVITGGVILWWMGMRPVKGEVVGRAAWGTAVIAVLLAFVLVIAGIESFQGARQAQIAAEDLRDLFPTGEVIDVASRSTNPMTVTATVRTEVDVTAADVATIEASLEERIGRDIVLEVVIERVVVNR